MQGIYDTITYDQVLALVKGRLRLTGTTDHDAMLETYINQGARHINNKRQLVPRNCVLDVKGNTVRMPSGFQEFVGLRFCQLANSPAPVDVEIIGPVISVPETYLFQDLVYLNYKWMRNCQVDPAKVEKFGHSDYLSAFRIVDGYIVFNFDVDLDYSKVQLGFIGANEDDQGRMIMYADYERAVMSYACWMHSSAYPEFYNQRFIDNEMLVWTKQKKFIQGEDQRRSWQENKWELQKLIHTMFVDIYILP